MLFIQTSTYILGATHWSWARTDTETLEKRIPDATDLSPAIPSDEMMKHLVKMLVKEL